MHKRTRSAFCWAAESLLICLILLLVGSCGAAPLSLAPYFSSNMVLQRGAKTRIWGTGVPGHWIRVEFEGKSKDGEKGDVKKDGIWSVELEGLKTNSTGASLLVIDTTEKTKTSILLTNVLIGDIWIVGISGGTGVPSKSAPLAEAPTPVRFLNLPGIVNEVTINRRPATEWAEPGAGDLSAMAFHLARHLVAEPDMRGVPLGLVVTDLQDQRGRIQAQAIEKPLPEFCRDALRESKADYDKAKQLESQEFLLLKRAGKLTDRPPLREFEVMHLHPREDFDPKNPPASVFTFKWVFNALL